jgi:hypothetical protein
MHAVIRRYEGADQNRVKDAMRQVDAEMVPILKKVPGFLGYYALDAGNGVVASISLFETREGAAASTREAADWVAKNLRDVISQSPQVTEGEVTVRHDPMPTGAMPAQEVGREATMGQ